MSPSLSDISADSLGNSGEAIPAAGNHISTLIFAKSSDEEANDSILSNANQSSSTYGIAG